VLNRRRSLSINMIRRLHEKLGISTEVLIRPSRANREALGHVQHMREGPHRPTTWSMPSIRAHRNTGVDATFDVADLRLVVP
jgi:hypothetical protein